jgi:hypothetical protein
MATAAMTSDLFFFQGRGCRDRRRMPTDTVIFPFQQVVLYKISRLLIKHNIKTIHVPAKKTASYVLRLIKDKVGFKVVGVCHMPCKCDKVCVGQTGRLIKTKCKEHMTYIHLGQSEKSAVVNIGLKWGVTLISTSILGKARGYVDHVINGAVRVRLYPQLQ